MEPQQSLIDQLQCVVASGDLSRRAEMLRRVTDLFIVGSGRFSGEQIDLFDGVMGKLVENIELTARVAFASRLAGVPDAPAKVIHALAFDDAIEVAAPVLARFVAARRRRAGRKRPHQESGPPAGDQRTKRL